MPDPRPLTLSRLLWRGFTKRCPLCGGGNLFGALGMNTVVRFFALFVTIVVGVAVTYPDIPTVPLMGLAVAVSVVVPLLFFPFSKTLWSAVDLAMRPLEPDDDVDPDWLPPATHHER